MARNKRVKWQGHNIYMSKENHDYLVRKGYFSKGKDTSASLRTGKVRATKAGHSIHMSRETYKRWKSEGN